MSSSQTIQIFVWLRLESGWASNTKVMDDFLRFPIVMKPSSYGWQFESYDLCKLGVLLKVTSGQNKITRQFGIFAYFPWKTGRTLNTGIIEHFITFLTRGRTQGFYFKWTSYDRPKLIALQDMILNSNRFRVSFGYNFHWITWLPKFILFMHMHMRDHDKMSVLYVPH
jgi:hypothetical protein